MDSIRCNSHVKSWRNKKNPQRIIKHKPFRNKYNWEGIDFPSGKGDWKKFEINNITTALNVFYAKKEKICPPICLKLMLIFIV